MKIPQAQALVLLLAATGIAAPVAKDAVIKSASAEATNHLAPLAFGAPHPGVNTRAVLEDASTEATDHLAPLAFGAPAVKTRAVLKDASTEAVDHLAPLAFGRLESESEARS